MRELVLGTLTPVDAALHVAYLGVLAIVGAILFERTLSRRLAR